MKKDIIILGDVEIGAGNLTDDFISDKALANMILKFAKKPYPVDIVFNGDTLDFLKCPHIIEEKITYPRHITESVSIDKLHSMYKAHEKVFTALKAFLKHEGHHIYFIIGNHDQDLLYKGVQREIKKILGKKQGIYFRLRYQKHEVYAEHGQQYDPLNRFNPDRLFLRYKGNVLLNIPWIGFGLITRFMALKEEHPFLERINPIPFIFANHKIVRRKISLMGLEYFLKSVLYYPFRYYNDPTYMFPRVIIGELYDRFKTVHYEVDGIVDKFRKRKRKIINKNKVLVLGHVHETYIEERDGWVILHPNTWRDEYIMNEETKMLTAKKKQYVLVELRNEQLSWELVHQSIKRKPIPFSDVLDDEIAILTKAAKEEDYVRFI